MSFFSKQSNLTISSPSKFINFLESSRRSKLHIQSTNSWLRTRHPETTSLSYLCFPFEREQHNLILEVFQLLDQSHSTRININELVRTISKFNGRIPKNFLWNFFHKHDLDKDDALNFEEFKTCALSQKGKIVFSNILKRMKKGRRLEDKNYSLPMSFNSLITQVSYKSARNDLLKRCCDTSVDINKRANYFFHLFGLQKKFKNPDDFYPDNSIALASQQNFKSTIEEKSRKSTLCDYEMKEKESFAYDPKFYKMVSDSEEIIEDEEIEKIVTDSKLKGEELAEMLKNSEKTKSMSQINIIAQLENPISSKLNAIDNNKDKKEGKHKRKLGKMNKIMIENLKDSKKNQASKLFKKIIAAKQAEEPSEKKRQIKFYPIRVKNGKENQELETSNERNAEKSSFRNEEFDLFLPRIEKIRNPHMFRNNYDKIPTMVNIFNEDFNKKKPKRMISEFNI